MQGSSELGAGESGELTDILGWFFLRLSQAQTLLDINTAAGVAGEELEAESDVWAVNGQVVNDVPKPL